MYNCPKYREYLTMGLLYPIDTFIAQSILPITKAQITHWKIHIDSNSQEIRMSVVIMCPLDMMGTLYL